MITNYLVTLTLASLIFIPSLSIAKKDYPLQGNKSLQLASLKKPVISSSIPCDIYQTLNKTNECLIRTTAIKQGLEQQAIYLRKNNGNIPSIKTIQRLLQWYRGDIVRNFSELFKLSELNFANSKKGAKFTGYITSTLKVRKYRDRQFNIPIYAKPKTGKMPTHGEIARGALAGKGLEVAWTDDAIELYFAQIQGSANVEFPNGETAILDYAGDNGYPYRKIATYLQQKNYMSKGFSNENIRRWLRANPQKIAEVMEYNRRFIFFNLKQGKPKTASGTDVIPWHTVAVDDQYIPLGSVLLAEVPKIDSKGRTISTTWQLLFAQDRGNNIRGQGRIDLYIGVGKAAERQAHNITGFRRTFLLQDKNS